MKQRNIVVCILLSLVTCGIYGIYKRRTGFPVLTDYMRDLCPVLDVPDGQCR